MLLLKMQGLMYKIVSQLNLEGSYPVTLKTLYSRQIQENRAFLKIRNTMNLLHQFPC
jgi:hypothetical protein